MNATKTSDPTKRLAEIVCVCCACMMTGLAIAAVFLIRSDLDRIRQSKITTPVELEHFAFVPISQDEAVLTDPLNYWLKSNPTKRVVSVAVAPARRGEVLGFFILFAEGQQRAQFISIPNQALATDEIGQKADALAMESLEEWRLAHHDQNIAAFTAIADDKGRVVSFIACVEEKTK